MKRPTLVREGSGVHAHHILMTRQHKEAPSREGVPRDDALVSRAREQHVPIHAHATDSGLKMKGRQCEGTGEGMQGASCPWKVLTRLPLRTSHALTVLSHDAAEASDSAQHPPRETDIPVYSLEPTTCTTETKLV